jgi:hypothetical protein
MQIREMTWDRGSGSGVGCLVWGSSVTGFQVYSLSCSCDVVCLGVAGHLETFLLMPRCTIDTSGDLKC